MRKIIIALIGAAVVAVLAMPTDVSARGRHGGGHGGWHGGGGGWRGGGGGWGYRGYSGYPYAYYPYAYGCYRNVRVFTPYGYAWRRVWVCG